MIGVDYVMERGCRATLPTRRSARAHVTPGRGPRPQHRKREKCRPEAQNHTSLNLKRHTSHGDVPMLEIVSGGVRRSR
eukprot:7022624-Prymnesium_polylepis.2